MPEYNIDPSQNYKRVFDGDVFTGRQILNFLEVVKRTAPETVATILLDYIPTDKPAMRPKLRYGMRGQRT